MNLGRFQYTPPWQAGWLEFRRPAHGGDEYGNCSVYACLPLLGQVVVFHDRHFQRDVEMPEPGECAWVDRRYYDDFSPEFRRRIEEARQHPERRVPYRRKS